MNPILPKRAPQKNRLTGILFTPCTAQDSLLEAVNEAAKSAQAGDVSLPSRAGSGFDKFQNHQEYGERLCQLVKSISGGGANANPNMSDNQDDALKSNRHSIRSCPFSLRGFLRENHGANHPTTHTSTKRREGVEVP